MLNKEKSYSFSNSAPDYQSELVILLQLVVSKITDDSNIVWTTYNSPAELRHELTKYIKELLSANYSCLESLKLHFAPTSTFQEHSLSNGWAKEYITISTKFDKFYDKLKL